MWQGFSLAAENDIEQPILLRYVRRLINGQASQQNLTPAIGLIMHFQVGPGKMRAFTRMPLCG